MASIRQSMFSLSSVYWYSLFTSLFVVDHVEPDGLQVGEQFVSKLLRGEAYVIIIFLQGLHKNV